jgi:hypothetical protein
MLLTKWTNVEHWAAPRLFARAMDKHSVVTIDRTDFQIDRRIKREAILLLCPPER